MPGGRPGFLSDVIVELGMVDAATVEGAVRAARTPGLRVERLLVESGALTEDQLSRATAERYGLDHLDLNQFEINPAAANLIDPGAAKRYQAVPVSFTDDGSLVIAMSDPSDALGINDIAVMTKLAVRPVVASKPDIEALREQLPLSPAGQAAPPGPEAEPQEDQEHATNGASAAPQARAEAAPTAVFWQPDGEGAAAPAPAPTGADADELGAGLEAEYQRAVERLKREYEARLRGQERTAAELQEELEAERAKRDRAIGKVRDELEAENSELKEAIRDLEGGIETARAEAEGAARALRSQLENEKAGLEQSLRELQTELDSERHIRE